MPAHDTRHLMPGEEPCVPEYNIACGFDVERSEWLLAWYCGTNLWAARVGWDGLPVVAEPSYLDEVDPVHSGIVLSRNRYTDRWLVQFQHDLAWVRATADGRISCLDALGTGFLARGDCAGPNPFPADTVSGAGVLVNGGGIWATGVDYAAGREFRLGGIAQWVGCSTSADCEFGSRCAPDVRCKTPTGVAVQPGTSFWSPIGRPFDARLHEAPFLWRSERTDQTLHQYIRVPAEELAVALTASGAWGGASEIRYTFLPEAIGEDFDA